MVEYVIVDIASEHKSLNDGNDCPFTYKGIDRAPWIQINDALRTKNASNEMKQIKKRSFVNYLGNFSPGTLKSYDDAVNLLKACDKEQIGCEIIAIDFLGNHLSALKNFYLKENFLGIDCYADSFGSLLVLGIFEKPEAFKEFKFALNKNGLFSSIEEIRIYINQYAAATNSANLEPIDDLNDVFLYAVYRT